MHIKSVFIYILLILGTHVNAQEQSYGGLKVSYENIRYNNSGEIFIRLRFENITDATSRPRSIAVAAFRVEGYLYPKATFNDQNGNTWVSQNVNGLSYGDGANDWLFLNSEGAAPITYSFRRLLRGEPAAPFFFDTELKMFNEEGGKMIRVPISLGPIQP